MLDYDFSFLLMPSVLKESTAFYPLRPGSATHGFEMLHYYEFRTRNISGKVKNIFAGISFPKLCLVEKAVIIKNGLSSRLEKIDKNSATNLLFLEEELPKE